MTPRPQAETYLASRLRLAWCGPSLLVLDLDGGCGRTASSYGSESPARWDEEVQLDVAWHLGADFADLLQAITEDQGPGSEAEEQPGGVVFRCRRAGLPLETRVGTGAGGWCWHDDGRLRATVTLHCQSPVELGLFVAAVEASIRASA